VTLVPEDTACPCCRAAMIMIGEDSSERLDVIPVQYRVIVTKRPKFACRTCVGTVVQAPAPARLIDGGIPTEALVAQVAIAAAIAASCSAMPIRPTRRSSAPGLRTPMARQLRWPVSDTSRWPVGLAGGGCDPAEGQPDR
jgi:zinc-finger binding domain of transposase IS66